MNNRLPDAAPGKIHDLSLFRRSDRGRGRRVFAPGEGVIAPALIINFDYSAFPATPSPCPLPLCCGKGGEGKRSGAAHVGSRGGGGLRLRFYISLTSSSCFLAKLMWS